jgi:alpha-glucosidase
MVQHCATERAWWQTAVVYQIYPLSFQDSNADGRGDLPGLLSRVEYLDWLGIDVVWLSPVYRSPMADFGYDIADFTAVDPVFGTLADFDRLLEALHARGIRLVLDYVPNHTSDQHPWFIESRSDRSSPKRDWYLWQDGRPGGEPPNNWLSRFGGSAWALDERTGQYYYHSFLREQPDLNWRNPHVRRAMQDVLHFWMQRGVDGFRVDASAVLAEDELLRDDPPNPQFNEATTPPPERLRRVFTDGRPETLEYLAELREVIDEYPGRVLLGEVQGTTNRIGRFYGDGQRPIFHLPLNFMLLDVPWDAASIAAAMDEYVNAVPTGAWPDWVLGSHDKHRIATRIGDAQARIAAMLLFTLRGTPIFFAGDELGAHDGRIPPDRVQDPFERFVPGFGLNRDPERVPMRWDPGPVGGFSAVEPWLPVADDVGVCNVARQRADEKSMLALYRRLIRLRREQPALATGEYIAEAGVGTVLVFRRRTDGCELRIMLNVGSQPQVVKVTEPVRVLLSSHLDRHGETAQIELPLRANEGVVARVGG